MLELLTATGTKRSFRAGAAAAGRAGHLDGLAHQQIGDEPDEVGNQYGNDDPWNGLHDAFACILVDEDSDTDLEVEEPNRNGGSNREGDEGLFPPEAIDDQ